MLDRTSRRVSISNSFLEIRNLSKSDHGRYECRAINNIATVVKVTNLRIDSKWQVIFIDEDIARSPSLSF